MTKTVYGDGSFFDIRNSDSIRIAREAIRESRREILDAFLGGPVRSVNESGAQISSFASSLRSDDAYRSFVAGSRG